MNARILLAQLKAQDIQVMACGQRLLVDAPRGALTQDLCAVLAERKPEILSALAEDIRGEMKARSSLLEYAAAVLPVVRLTIVETGSAERDFTFLHRLRRMIEEHQPGGNRVLLRIKTTDGRRIVVEWRAVAARTLRLGLAHILAGDAKAQRGAADPSR